MSTNENEDLNPEVGQTSEEMAADSGKKKKKSKKKSKKKKQKKSRPKGAGHAQREKEDINLWDVMMIISLICIVVACILLFMELRSFSNFPFSYPWKTTDVRF